MNTFELLYDVLEEVRAKKPNDRSEVDRRYAILITELEKLVAYSEYWLKPVES